MKHLTIILIAVTLCSIITKAQSANDTIVIDCQGHTVIPYGRAKVLTITEAKLNVKMVTLTYKLETEMKEKPVLIANYTEGNIACGTSSFHYYSKGITRISYTMTEDKIKFVLSPQSFVSGNVLVRIFLVEKDDANGTSYLAISNVVSLRADF